MIGVILSCFGDAVDAQILLRVFAVPGLIIAARAELMTSRSVVSLARAGSAIRGGGAPHYRGVKLDLRTFAADQPDLALPRTTTVNVCLSARGCAWIGSTWAQPLHISVVCASLRLRRPSGPHRPCMDRLPATGDSPPLDPARASRSSRPTLVFFSLARGPRLMAQLAMPDMASTGISLAARRAVPMPAPLNHSYRPAYYDPSARGMPLPAHEDWTMWSSEDPRLKPPPP
jgi:hypothetical protein